MKMCMETAKLADSWESVNASFHTIQKLASIECHESASNFSQNAVHQLPWVYCILPLAQSQVGSIHCIVLQQSTTWCALHHSLCNLHSLATTVATGCYY